MIHAYCYEDSLIINSLVDKAARFEKGYNECRATLKDVADDRNAMQSEIEKLRDENHRIRMLLSIVIASFEQTANQVKNVKEAL